MSPPQPPHPCPGRPRRADGRLGAHWGSLGVCRASPKAAASDTCPRGQAAAAPAGKAAAGRRQGFVPLLFWAVSSLAEGQSPFPASRIFGYPQVFTLPSGCGKGAGLGALRLGPSALTQCPARSTASRGATSLIREQSRAATRPAVKLARLVSCQELQNSATTKIRRDRFERPSLLPTGTTLGQIPEWSYSILILAALRPVSVPQAGGLRPISVPPGRQPPLRARSWPALASEHGSWKGKLQ